MLACRRRPFFRSTALALCTIGASAARVRSGEPAGRHVGATPVSPPFIEARPGEALPDWLLEDGRGRRFHLSETRGRPLVLTVGVPSRRLLENVGGASGVMTVLAQAARSIALPDVG